MDFPHQSIPHLFVTPFSEYGAQHDISVNGGGGVGNPASAAWPSANRAYYFPFRLPIAFPIRRMFVGNGSGTIAGTWDVGVYSIGGTRIISSGTQTQSGGSALQYVTPTEMILPPGSYYLAMSASSGTATYFGFTNSVATAREVGMLQQASAHALPATATFAALAAGAFVPVFGLCAMASGF